MIAFAISVLVGLIGLALRSLVVMLALAALHSHVETIPALGYVASLWLTLLVSVLVVGARSAD